MSMNKELQSCINDAHGDGYDTVELPIETARGIMALLESQQNKITDQSKMIDGLSNDLADVSIEWADERALQAEEIESLRAELDGWMSHAKMFERERDFVRDDAQKTIDALQKLVVVVQGERDEARKERDEYKSGAMFWSDYAKGMEIKLEKQQQDYEVLLDIVRGFVIWEDMFPVRKNYNKTEPCMVDDDYEAYRFNVDAARRLLAQYDTAQPTAQKGIDKDKLLNRINSIRNEHIEKRNEGDDCDQYANDAVADWFAILQKEIESGEFEITAQEEG